MTYKDCLELISKSKVGRLKLKHNTYLEQRGESFVVIFHRTAVVKIFPDDRYQLFTGGWHTVTTKQRINQFSPARVYQERGDWYLDSGREFFEGVIVSAAGEVYHE